MKAPSIVFFVVFIFTTSVPLLASAQNRYVCRTASGVQYPSDKPCAATLYYGPVAERQSGTTYIPKAAEAPEHLKYLSPQCSTLSEGIRTSAARGLKYDTVAELQKNYQIQCAEDDRDARLKLNAERNETAVSKKTAKQMAALSQEQNKIQQQQCDESKRIIFLKKKRLDLTDGERQDLQRFEQNYKARCE